MYENHITKNTKTQTCAKLILNVNTEVKSRLVDWKCVSLQEENESFYL